MGIVKNNNFKLKHISLTDDTSVIATGTNTQTLTPPTGKIYIIRMIYYHAPDPAGSSAGTHELTIQRIMVTTARRLAFLRSTTGNAIYYNDLVMNADSSEIPTSVQEQFLLNIGGLIVASNSYPIQFKYDNDTDVAQAGTRTLEILVEEHNEVS